MIIKTYSELAQLHTFEERFRYLQMSASVGKDTFGFDRYLNQMFYKTAEWKSLRDYIIVRDNGCDLGIEGYEIDRSVSIYIHHMNPITKDDIINRSEYLLNPEYLITTIFPTHNAIHYGDETLLNNRIPVQRTRNDTCPWKR
jgi:hypothetical protein